MANPKEDGTTAPQETPLVRDASHLDILGPEIKSLLVGRRFTVRKQRSDSDGVPMARIERGFVDQHGVVVMPDATGGLTRFAVVQITEGDQASIIPLTIKPQSPEMASAMLPPVADEPETHIGVFIGYDPAREAPRTFRTGMVRSVSDAQVSFPLAFMLAGNTLDEIPYRLTGDNMKPAERNVGESAGLFAKGFEPTRTRGVIRAVARFRSGEDIVPVDHPLVIARSTLLQVGSHLVREPRSGPPINDSMQSGLYLSLLKR